MNTHETTAVNQILSHVNQYALPYSHWYAGIATRPRDRLFVDHSVDEANGVWVYQNAGSETAARNLEQYLIDLGMDGGSGGGVNPTYVYAYLKTATTKP